jgi:hypothetical protein
MQVLTEFVQINKSNIIKEGDNIRLTGLMQRANAKNANSRIYPRQLLEREIENYTKMVRDSRALGECDHPLERAEVYIKEASHIVEKIWWEGDEVHGTIRVLTKTPNGKIAAALIDEGVTLGISSRGLGSTHRKGDDIIVNDDFQLVCFDLVTEPSTSGAFMLRENVDMKKILTKPDRIYRIMNDILMR